MIHNQDKTETENHINSIMDQKLKIDTVFENPPKSRIQHCERSELRLKFFTFFNFFRSSKNFFEL